MRALALTLALLAGTAAAQTPLPDEVVSAQNRERFQLCRAAIFYHLGAPQSESRVPHEVAETMLEQINFIMFETVRSAPAASVADSKRALGFVEQFFITFSKTIAETRTRFTDVNEREKQLVQCMPFIWSVVRERIDYLIQWRERAVDAPGHPNRLGEALKR